MDNRSQFIKNIILEYFLVPNYSNTLILEATLDRFVNNIIQYLPGFHAGNIINISFSNDEHVRMNEKIELIFSDNLGKISFKKERPSGFMSFEEFWNMDTFTIESII